MSVHVLYTATAAATGGRDGRVTADCGGLDIAMVTPPPLGDSGGAAFRGGVCIVLPKRDELCRQPRSPWGSRECAAHCHRVGPHAHRGFGLEVRLDVSLPGLPRADAEALMRRALLVCPYSNAIRNDVPVQLELT